ncbi:glycoside hydrolase family 3 N-terminal domain-containing protein [Subtercola sp. RTI3]|uniref:glycoside hydrolase family 3 N-terminal domain-containing protein n=1 Tax=Subtercola sp. RTI3 TaxID=3048639 RepID=UPI002B226B8C|nr:glycoside hydrolase family 3 N-terminal domain-containing protein [Subtercola sp. RTI3]MEA9987235.1 glycoside hydrolase family 3 N-terminal domain-containing protein [Subtercola sp. RTI3]
MPSSGSRSAAAPATSPRPGIRSRLRALLSTGIVVAVMGSALVVGQTATAAEPDLARSGTTTASAAQNDKDGNFPASNATDGNATTRWASGNGPDSDTTFTASLTSDLGSVATVTGVTISWEAAFATAYDIQVASANPADDASWSTAASKTTGAGGTEQVAFSTPMDARYVRLAMLKRTAATWEAPTLHYYGYSVFSFEVHGTVAVPTASFDASALSVGAGDDAAVHVSLNSTSTTDQSVHVTSTDGTAAAGTDFTAVDQTVSIPAGQTTATVTVPTVSHGALAPERSFTLALSDPSAGITIGTRNTATVTLKPTGTLPNAGATTVLQGFEAGVPADYSTWASADSVKPVLSTKVDDTVPGAATDNRVLVATVGGAPTASDWFGFTNDTSPKDWSASDGFSFWFLGQGSGKTLSYELKSGGQIFDQSVVDTTTGWRQISVLFDDLRLKGNHTDPARFLPGASAGFAVTLTGLGAGTFSFDDFATFERATTLEDFQGAVPLGTSTNPVGFFTWGSADNLATMAVTPQVRGDVPDNKVLAGTYKIPSGGYAGFSDNLSSSQNWSSYRGIRFWWYASQASNPASPTAGDDIKVEIKDGGPDGEHSELWSTTFKDNWGSSTSRWKLIELPFTAFTIGSYQPGSAATQNGTLDLTSAWGFAITFAPGKPTSTGWAVDDAQLYGTPAQAANLTVNSTKDVYLVNSGETASVGLTLTTSNGDALTSPVTVKYAPGSGAATVGTQVADFTGSVTFAAGTASGTTQSFDVKTIATPGGDQSRSISVALDAAGAQLPASAPRVVINAHGLPYLDSSLPVATRVDDLMSRMTLAEKVGQMTQAERLGLSSPSQIADLGLGSILSGGGSTPAANTPAAWADMVDGFQQQALSTALQIPLLYGADAVHGHSNVLDATIFPHNIGLGATRDPALIQTLAEDTAVETKATGVNWAFAPCLCVGRDERWGRTYESFGEDPALVTTFSAANIVGLQGSDPADKSGPDKVLATAKHWAGDGGTSYDASKVGNGYPIDQGLTHSPSMADFMTTYVDPYIPAIDAGVGSIMPSYSGVDIGGTGDVRMHENTALNTGVLKEQLGFNGFLISDWEGIDKLPGGTYAEKAVRSVNSGLDMAMAPYNFGAFITSITDAVGAKSVAATRVDDAVRRILTQKFELGLFEHPLTDRSKASELGSDAHRADARQAAAESQVLLKNDGVLPLAKNASIYVAGSNADDLGNQMGGWTISWQGASGNSTTAGTTILAGMKQAAPDAAITYSKDASAPMAAGSVGVVVVGETPYAEGQGDVGNNGHSLSLTDSDRATIDKVCGAMKCVVLVVAGRTQLVTDKLSEISGLVASFLPGSEGEGVADTLFGDTPFTGRLPLTWPATAEQVPINVGDATYDPLFAYGWGERTDSPKARLEKVSASLAAGAAKMAVDALLSAAVWSPSGTVSEPAAAIQLAVNAAAQLGGTDSATLADADLLVSVVRDLAQASVTANTAVTGSSSLTADAEHALLGGDSVTAVTLLAKVLGLAVAVDPGTGGTDPGAGSGAGGAGAGSGTGVGSGSGSATGTTGQSSTASGQSSGSAGPLATTGSQLTLALLLALMLSTSGALLFVARRRRRLTP